MPNTLAHIGVQGPISRPFLSKSDLKWVYIGCILPDIPWILQRAVRFAGLDVNAYNLWLYVIIQSSLLFSIILGSALAMFSVRYWKVFAILSLNALLHLLLDATQIKWANGVHLFAPFTWKLTEFGFFWPENVVTYLLTIAGIVFFVIMWKKAASGTPDLKLDSPRRYMGFIILAAAYVVVPLFLLNAPEKEDNHFVHTLRDYDSRKGKYVELDRKDFNALASTISAFGDEEIRVKGVDLSEIRKGGKNLAVLSIRGRFIAPDTIQVLEYHIHNATVRDGASYVGISMILILWVVIVWKQSTRKKN